jgi:hypothetical protein
MQKRGLSTVIVTLILILVSLVAVGIIWVVVRNVIQTGTEGVGLSQFSLSAKILDVSIDNSSNNISLTVKRNAGKGELEGISFVFSSGENNEVITRSVSLKELEQMKFYFHLINTSVSDLTSVSIVPLIKQDEKQIIGIALDKYNLGNKNNIQLQACVPTNCSTLGYVCGTWNNGTCSGTLSCGNCSGGQICNASGRCVASCVPATCAGLGYQCGSGYANGTCSGTLNCGNCSGGQICNASGRCVSTGNYTYALSCSQINVQNAVNSASDGDTVLVPAGTCLWTVAGGTVCYGGYTVGVCVKKGIKLQGGFGGTTTIIMDLGFTRGGLQLNPDSTSLANNETFEVTGFTFEGGGQAMNEGILNVRSSGTTIMHNLKIHNNTFKNVTNTAININGAVNGVVYENTFTNIGYSVRTFGYDLQGWSTFIRQYGQSDNLFVEDNIINFTIDLSDVGGTDHGQGAPGYVFRYNTFNLSNTAGGWLFTIHGLQSMSTTPGYTCPSGCGYDTCTPSVSGSCNGTVDACQQWSTIKSEYYGNTITDTPYLHAIMGHRGSWLMMFDNQISSPGSTPPIAYSQYSCDSCQDPSTPAYSQHVQNSYIFNNLYNSINVPMTKGLDFCADASVGTLYTITENVDYWNYKSSFNGVTGIGRGTLASRPTTCTTGVGYWATDQGEWNSKHAGADGQFYKCISTNNWQLYYTPYTYPHPLRTS